MSAQAAPPVVRAATAEDLDALVALEVECEGADAWSENLVREGVTGRLPTTTWLVTEGGYAVLAVVDDTAELQRIGVTAARRRQGIARALLDAVVDRASRDAVRLLLEVREGNDPALALYASAGFVEISRRPRYYRDGAAAVVMELALPQGR